MGRARDIANLIGGATPDIILKTSDGAILNLQTSDTTVTQDSVLGAINFQAPDEADGTDAILVASKIEAIAEGTFSASSNATSLVFTTASSAAAGTASGKMTFTSGGELVIKDPDTADGSSPTITLQSGDTDIAQDDVLGTINFQAPDEGTGTDAILVAAGISAISEGDFSSSSNATKLSFKTGASEAAAEKMSLSSAGLLTVSGRIITDDTTEATSTTDGSLQTDGGLSVAKDIVAGDDVKLLSDSAVLSFGADSEVTLSHAHNLGILVNSTNGIFFDDASNLDQFIKSEGSDFLRVASPTTLDLQSTTVTVSNDMTLDSDSSLLSFGADAEVSLRHVHDSGLRIQDSIKLFFGNSDDLEIFHDATDSKLNNNTGKLILETGTDNAIILKHNSNGVMETDANGIIVSRATTSTTFSMKANTSSGTGTPQFQMFRSGTRFGFMEAGVNSSANGLGDHFALRAEQGDIFAIDSSNNSTQLSPHNFAYIPDGASETGAWCYKSDKFEREVTETDEDGNKTKEKIKSGTFISADITKVIRQVEKLTGEKLIYKGTLDVNEDGEVSKHNDDGSKVTENIIDGLVKRIEALEAANKLLLESA